MLEKKDLKEGKTYELIYERYSVIARCYDINKLTGVWSIETGHSTTGFAVNGSFYPKGYKEATHEHTMWLDACIKADKYIPLEDINFNEKVELNYEIY